MDIIQFVPESLLILVAVLWFLGEIIKKLTFVKNEFIPFILAIVGIGFALFLQSFDAQSALQGIICAASAVYGNNVVKQLTTLVSSTSTTDTKTK